MNTQALQTERKEWSENYNESELDRKNISEWLLSSSTYSFMYEEVVSCDNRVTFRSCPILKREERDQVQPCYYQKVFDVEKENLNRNFSLEK